MAKITELIPGQVWEDDKGRTREVLAAGPTLFVTSRRGEPPYVWDRAGFQVGLDLMHRLVRPRVKMWVTVYQNIGLSYYIGGNYESLEQAQQKKSPDCIAIVPVEFAEGDNLPQ